MNRLLRRLSSRQRNALAVIALFITLNVFVVSEYTVPRNLALSLDDIYDPPTSYASNASYLSELDTYMLDEEPPSKPSAPAISVKPLPRVLLVSALFQLPATHSSFSDSGSRNTSSRNNTTAARYLASLSRYLGSITTDVYFYTTPDLASSVLAARGPGLSMTLDTTFATPFDVPPLKGREAVYENMHEVDGEKEREGRTKELYAMWNAKAYYLERAVKSTQASEEGRGYDYAFWTDVDIFAEANGYTDWPDVRRLDMLWKEGANLAGSERKEEDLMFFPMIEPPSKKMKEWMEDLGPIDGSFTEGSFFGGPTSTVLWFSRAFYAYHDHFLSLGYFSGVDSSIYNALLLLYPSRFITVWPSDPKAPARGGMPPGFLGHGGKLGTCGQERNYYQWWLSDRGTRERISDRWMMGEDEQGARPELTEEFKKRVGRGWWKMRVPCRLTRVLAVESVLKGVFGKEWTPPIATVTKPRRTW